MAEPLPGTPREFLEVVRRGGYGDAIMATARRPGEPWHVRETTRERFIFDRRFRVRPGRLELSSALTEWAAHNVSGAAIVIEPNVKGTASADNKQWPWERYADLVSRVPLPWVQCAPEGARTLPGVEVLRTPSFWHAAAAIRRALGYVGPEGGLHHAAGALGADAVIVFGGFNSPEMYGYPWHSNLHVADESGWGWRRSHPACRAAMDAISVEQVAAACRQLWIESPHPTPDAFVHRPLESWGYFTVRGHLVCVPHKAGTTSFRAATLPEHRDAHHWRALAADRGLGPLSPAEAAADGRPTILAVRDPIERFRSLVKNLLDLRRNNRLSAYRGLSPDALLDLIERHPRGDRHWYSQADYHVDGVELVRFDRLLPRLGLRSQWRNRRRGESPRIPAHRVRALYARDVELWEQVRG